MFNKRDLHRINEQVYKKLKTNTNSDYVFKRKNGILYFLIREISKESDPNFDIEEICRTLDITQSNSQDKDFRIVKDLFSNQLFTEDQISSKISLASMEFKQNKEEFMEWLVATVCILVGIFTCLQYLKGPKKQDQIKGTYQEIQRSAPSEAKSHEPAERKVVSLCLVVPAFEVGSHQIGSKIYGNRLKELVTSSSYFLCKPVREVLEIQQNLPLTDDPIPTDSPRGVYVQIDIEDGQEMIDKGTRYEIKENINDSQEYIIIQIKCLRSLSGLEPFTRI